MLLSGFVVFLVGILFAHPLPRRLDRLVAGLARRRVLAPRTGSILDVIAALRAERRRWRFWGGGVCAAAIAAAFVVVLIGRFSYGQLGLGIVETVFAFAAGRYLGAMAHSSVLAHVLRRRGVDVVIRPSALDGAGGLASVGGYFFRQASIASMPAIYISLWLLLIPAFPRYKSWLEPYCGLLVVALAFTVLAFVLPLWAFHGEMQRQKDAYGEKADEIAGRINTLRDEWFAADDQVAQAQLRAEIEAQTQIYREIDALPTWPVAPATRRRFTINNTILTFPLAVRGLDQLGIGGDILRWIGARLSA